MKGLRTLVVALLVLATCGSVWAQWEWERLTSTPRACSSGSAMTLGRASDTSLYVAFGGTNKFYRYYAKRNTWDDGPDDLPQGRVFRPGAALASNKDNYIFALLGTYGNKKEFWRYKISDNTWLQYADIPDSVSEGGALAYAYREDFAWVYATVGGQSNKFYRFGPVALPGQGDTRDIPRWRELAPLPDSWRAWPGACLAWSHDTSFNVDTIFCIPCDTVNRRKFLAYSPPRSGVPGTWRESRGLGADERAGPGASLAALNDSVVGQWLGALFGDQPGGEYDDEAGSKRVKPSPESWTHFTDTLRQGMGAAICSGDDYYFYVFFGAAQNHFYRHYYKKQGVEDGAQVQERTGHEGYSLAVRPNPAGLHSVIRFTLPARGNCRLTLCDVAGRIVGNPVEHEFARGCHALAWASLGTRLPAGVYVLRLETSGSAAMAKVVVR